MTQAGETRVKPRRGPAWAPAPAHKQSIWNDGTSGQQLSCSHEGDTLFPNRLQKDPRKQIAERSLGTLGKSMDQVHSPRIVGIVSSHIPITLKPI